MAVPLKEILFSLEIYRIYFRNLGLLCDQLTRVRKNFVKTQSKSTSLMTIQ